MSIEENKIKIQMLHIATTTFDFILFISKPPKGFVIIVINNIFYARPILIKFLTLLELSYINRYILNKFYFAISHETKFIVAFGN